MGWWNAIWKTQAENWTYVELDPRQVSQPIPFQEIQPDTGYLSIVLQSMRIVNVRRGISKFYGAVHSWISVPNIAQGTAQFQVLTTPSELKNIDAANLDRVISMDQRLLGPVPYRGGDLGLEIGLFSIKSADLAGPYLNLLEDISKVAGVSYVSAAMPFVEPIKTGINLLAGADKDSILEVGHSRASLPPRTGYFAVIRAPRGSIDTSQLRLADDRRLEIAGTAIRNYPYIVWSLELTPHRSDWFLIPELQKAYADLRVAVQTGRSEVVDDSFAAFRRLALTSPDLLFEDAGVVAKKVEQQVKDIVTPTQTALAPGKEQNLPDLHNIKVVFEQR
jgi:hypothetical protein